MKILSFILFVLVLSGFATSAQTHQMLLKDHWKAKRCLDVQADGQKSRPSYRQCSAV